MRFTFGGQGSYLDQTANNYTVGVTIYPSSDGAAFKKRIVNTQANIFTNLVSGYFTLQKESVSDNAKTVVSIVLQLILQKKLGKSAILTIDPRSSRLDIKDDYWVMRMSSIDPIDETYTQAKSAYPFNLKTIGGKYLLMLLRLIPTTLFRVKSPDARNVNLANVYEV